MWRCNREHKLSQQRFGLYAKLKSVLCSESFCLVFGAALFVFLWLSVLPVLLKFGFVVSEFHTIVFSLLYVFFVATCVLFLRGLKERNRKINELHYRLDAQNHDIRSLREDSEYAHQSISGLQKSHDAVINAIDHVVFETDKVCKLVFVNTAWSALTGFDIDASLGHSLVQYIHPDDQDSFTRQFSDLSSTNKPKMHMYTQMRTESGKFVAVEIALGLVMIEGASQRRLIGTIQNVEQRRRAERALGEAEKKYRSIVENAAGGIYQLTPEGIYLSANLSLARILGYQSPESLLRGVKNANDDVYVDKAARADFVQRLLASDQVMHRETIVRRADGQEIWANENARVVRDDTGEVLFLEGSIEDIDERKRADLVIREAKTQSDMANRAKSEFIANMSHELRTPLNAIIGFSELIKNEVYGALPDEKYKDYADDIYESGQGLLNVINEILDISKIDSGDRQLNEEPLNMQGVVRDCLELLQHKVTNNEMIITNALDHIPTILAEELAMKQVMMNLLSNALKFTPQGGRITLSFIVETDGRLAISVTDTGVGLTQDEVEKALMPFGQIDADHARHGKGTGLGLTLVKSLMGMHGGELDLFSQKGIGTTATVVLPEYRVMKSKASHSSEKASEDV